MDWQKAKAILLAAFLVLDLALLHALRHPAVAELRPVHLARPAEDGPGARPGGRPPVALQPGGLAVPELEVRPRPVPAAAVAALVPPGVREGRVGWRQTVDGGTLYAWDGHWAWLAPGGRFLFVAAGTRPVGTGRPSAEQAAAFARRWLERHAGPLADLQPASPPAYDPFREGYVVRWEQRAADGLPLFDGAVQLAVAGGGLVGFDWRVWEWWRPPSSRLRPVVPLQRLLDGARREGSRSRGPGAPGLDGEPAGARLGYRLEPGGDAARLVWRLATAPGHWRDFDAFTGAPLDPGRP